MRITSSKRDLLKVLLNVSVFCWLSLEELMANEVSSSVIHLDSSVLRGFQKGPLRHVLHTYLRNSLKGNKDTMRGGDKPHGTL